MKTYGLQKIFLNFFKEEIEDGLINTRISDNALTGYFFFDEFDVTQQYLLGGLQRYKLVFLEDFRDFLTIEQTTAKYTPIVLFDEEEEHIIYKLAETIFYKNEIVKKVSQRSCSKV